MCVLSTYASHVHIVPLVACRLPERTSRWLPKRFRYSRFRNSTISGGRSERSEGGGMCVCTCVRACVCVCVDEETRVREGVRRNKLN